ncbi:MAG: hypothetical protein LBH25_00515 [Fibromonadaceae bacterium]|nr:hypothetical protein [Fibromonadaceae bacterium]
MRTNITITLLALFCTVVFAQQKGTFTDTRDKKAYKPLAEGLLCKNESGGSECSWQRSVFF